jgi:hypothetical protein
MDEPRGTLRDRRTPPDTPPGEEVVEAWRAASGHGLAFFLPGLRRAVLEPGTHLSELIPDELSELAGKAVPLTATEAVIDAPDGRRWLAQARGPVWAGAGTTAGLCGTVFTSLDGPFERFESEDASPWLDAGSADTESLTVAWRSGRVTAITESDGKENEPGA